MHRRLPQTRAGQGLMELIIAVGIILTGVVGTMTLVISTIQVSNSSKTQILAGNLAREGVEVVRSIRDNNWLAMDSGLPGVTWNQLLHDAGNPTDYTGVATFIPDQGIWQLTYGPDTAQFPGDTTAIYLNPITGVYSQWENPGTVPANFSKIDFWRLITLNPICWDKNLTTPTAGRPEVIVPGDGSTCQSPGVGDANYTQVGMEVRSRVRWKEHGKAHTIELVDKLFNWKT